MAKLANVNVHDIRDAISLGCHTMCNVFNRDDNDVPFFGSRVRPEAKLAFSPIHSESHVPGRHLNALLTAQAMLNVEVNEECLDKHARAAFFSYSGPVPLPLNRNRVDGKLINFAPHNIREGFHALFALAKYRDSRQARELAEASIEAITRLWSPVNGWDRHYLQDELGLKVIEWDGPFVTGIARAIGPLVKYYRATNYGPALELAITLKEEAVKRVFSEGGDYDPETFGTHTHSTTCVLSSLAQLADLTVDAHLMGRVKAFFDNGLNEIRDELGWVIENSGPDAEPDRGEVNNTGDIAETALLLASWGWSEYYGNAERILRDHLLPSQLRDVSFIGESIRATGGDGTRDVAARHLGAFGFPAPYGHEPIGADHVSFNMDIVGGAVASLCEAYRAITHFDEAGHHVNLLFDHETDAIKVESPYTSSTLRVTVKRPGPLFVRIPSWADLETIKIADVQGPIRTSNGYLFIAQPPLHQTLSIELAMPEEEIVLAHRTRQIHVRMRGDQVLAMENFGADLTFFDPVE